MATNVKPGLAAASHTSAFCCKEKLVTSTRGGNTGSTRRALKRALTQVLVDSFYPVAGDIFGSRLSRPMQPLSNNRGVDDFIEAYANVELKNLDPRPDGSTHGKLVASTGRGVLYPMHA